MNLKRYFPKWSALRTVGNLWVVRLTVLIPLVGYFVIFNENVVQYTKLVSELVAPMSDAPDIEVSPRLLQVYFALCFVAAGSAIYSLLCPAIIKRYDSAPSFVAGDAPHLSDFEFEKMEAELRASYLESEYRRIKSRYEGRENMTQISEVQKRQTNIGVMHLHYRLLDVYYPVWRLVASLAYLVGFILLSIPSIRIFLRVFSILQNLIAKYGLAVL